MSAGVVFLLDVDNTLLDSDRFMAELQAHLTRELGDAGAHRYGLTLDMLRSEKGYVDYLGALQQFARGAVPAGSTSEASASEEQLLSVASFLLDYPFAQRLYPRALEVIYHLGRFGQPVILTDGDAVLQPRKVQRSGLWAAVGGRVLIGAHKTQLLREIESRYPAQQYVLVDDKLRNLMAMKALLRERLTTIFPRQGHYAFDAAMLATCTPADFTIDSIGELADVDLSALTESAAPKVEQVRDPASIRQAVSFV